MNLTSKMEIFKNNVKYKVQLYHLQCLPACFILSNFAVSWLITPGISYHALSMFMYDKYVLICDGSSFSVFTIIHFYIALGRDDEEQPGRYQIYYYNGLLINQRQSQRIVVFPRNYGRIVVYLHFYIDIHYSISKWK